MKTLVNIGVKSHPPPMQLGRWSLKHGDGSYKKETRVVFWANSDHCGDTLCGDVEKSKELLEENVEGKNRATGGEGNSRK